MSEEIILAEAMAKSFPTPNGDRTQAILDLGFSLKEREFLVIVGPSGCGKTTLLRLVANLIRPDRGQVLYRGQAAAGVPPWLSVVFQDYTRSLFPWLTVEGNVRFPLKGLDRRQAVRKAREALELVRLLEFAGHYPWQLSGGMQQRVAIARALASGSDLLLMDEPFASVDAQTRIGLEAMLLRLWENLGLTVLFVTHDIEEAIFMADRVLVLSARPATVLAELHIDLPRPRDEIQTKALPAFQQYRRRVFEMIGVDVSGRIGEAGA